MYKSPIEVMFGQIQTQIDEDMDKHIYKTVQEVGVGVDKDELIKALNYDRDQYQKGYDDGYRAAIEKLMKEEEEVEE